MKKTFLFFAAMMLFAAFITQQSCKTHYKENNDNLKDSGINLPSDDFQGEDKPRGVMAYPDTIKYQYPDDYLLLIFLYGDENAHIAKTVDDYVILMNDEGFYEYAVKNEEGEFVLSGIIARNPEDRSPEDKRFLNSINDY